VRRIGFAIALAVALVAGCTSSGVDSSNLPPAGQIWFGNSFDSSTFVLSGRADTFSAGTTFAFVAHFSKTYNGPFNIRVTLNGTQVEQDQKSTSGEWDYFGSTYNSAVLPAGGGAVTIDVFDVGNNTLATGTANVSP
jgi:hypothetical protein